MTVTAIRPLKGPVFVSAQVPVADVPELAREGFTLLVNHRPDHEEPGQPTAAALAEAAAREGLRLIWIPVRGLPDAAAVEATSEALAGLGAGGKALLFCRSGMRSAAAWAMACCAGGADPAEVRAAAAGAGYDLSRLPL